MEQTPDNSVCAAPPSLCLGVRAKARRRGQMNLHPSFAVNSDQALNPGIRVGCGSTLLTLCGEWSGGKYAGLKPSLAR